MSWKNNISTSSASSTLSSPTSSYITSIINIIIKIKFNQVEAKEAKISWKNKARRVSLAARLRPK